MKFLKYSLLFIILIIITSTDIYPQKAVMIYSIVSSPTSVTINQGQTLNNAATVYYTIDLAQSTTRELLDLSVQSKPAGITVSFSKTVIDLVSAQTDNTILTITASSTASSGNLIIQSVGRNTLDTYTITIPITVNVVNPTCTCDSTCSSKTQGSCSTPCVWDATSSVCRGSACTSTQTCTAGASSCTATAQYNGMCTADTSAPTCTGTCGLTSAPTGSLSNGVTLNWKSATDVNNVKYRIYRKINTAITSTPSSSDLLTEITTPATITYTDTGVSSGTYYYVVRPIDYAGNEDSNIQQGSSGVTITQPSSISSVINPGALCYCEFDLSGTTYILPKTRICPVAIALGSPNSGTKDSSCTCSAKETNLACSDSPYSDGTIRTYSATCDWFYTSNQNTNVIPNTYSTTFNAQGYYKDCRSTDNTGLCTRSNGATFPPAITDNLGCRYLLLSDNTVYDTQGTGFNAMCTSYNSVVGSGFCKLACTGTCPSGLACINGFCDITSNSPPTCTLNAATTTPGTNVAMTATSSDANNDVLTYTCSTTTGATCTPPAPAIPGSTSVTVGSTTAGTYTVTLNVNDGRGGIGSCQNTLTVNACGADGQPACNGGSCNAGNVDVSGTCYPECSLSSASISGSSCAGTNGCQTGESVSISFTYTGACLYRSINNIQVDASAAGCNVQYNPALSNVDNQFNKNSLTGLLNLHVSDGSRTITINSDPISAIDSTCISKTVSATAGALRNGVPPATPNFVATSVSGSVKFGCTTSAQCSNWAADSVCNANGNCECPNGFTKSGTNCVPTLAACFQRNKITGTIEPLDCQTKWNLPLNQNNNYWYDAKKHADGVTLADNCFRNVASIRNQQACLFESESASIEYGTYKDIHVYAGNTLVS